jgi:hypothetical protein
MKKKILFTGGLVLIASFFSTSCELDTCMICKEVTYVNNVYSHETNPNEFCGAALIAIEAKDDFIDGNIRTTWECK